ncbi:MAG: hypothetical protein KDD47_10680, partial [Acidobacteria bacterium]|nr:hypothetical protein [Acidobacteriota bacterium]
MLIRNRRLEVPRGWRGLEVTLVLLGGALLLLASRPAGAVPGCQVLADGPRACSDVIRVGAISEAYLDVTANDGHELGLAIYVASTGTCEAEVGGAVPGVTLTIVHDGPQADARGDLVRFRYQAPAPPPGEPPAAFP